MCSKVDLAVECSNHPHPLLVADRCLVSAMGSTSMLELVLNAALTRRFDLRPLSLP